MERINLKFESIPETKFSQFFFGFLPLYHFLFLLEGRC